jgi:hypothetical protein
VVTSTIEDMEQMPIDTSKLPIKLFPHGTYKSARKKLFLQSKNLTVNLLNANTPEILFTIMQKALSKNVLSIN